MEFFEEPSLKQTEDITSLFEPRFIFGDSLQCNHHFHYVTFRQSMGHHASFWGLKKQQKGPLFIQKLFFLAVKVGCLRLCVVNMMSLPLPVVQKESFVLWRPGLLIELTCDIHKAQKYQPIRTLRSTNRFILMFTECECCWRCGLCWSCV